MTEPQAALHSAETTIIGVATGVAWASIGNNQTAFGFDGTYLYFNFKDAAGNIRTILITAPSAGQARTI